MAAFDFLTCTYLKPHYVLFGPLNYCSVLLTIWAQKCLSWPWTTCREDALQTTETFWVMLTAWQSNSFKGPWCWSSCASELDNSWSFVSALIILHSQGIYGSLFWLLHPILPAAATTTNTLLFLLNASATASHLHPLT